MSYSNIISRSLQPQHIEPNPQTVARVCLILKATFYAFYYHFTP